MRRLRKTLTYLLSCMALSRRGRGFKPPKPLPLKMCPGCVRTCHAGRHKRGEHEKEHSEEQTAGVVVDLGRLVADVHVQHTDEDSDHEV